MLSKVVLMHGNCITTYTAIVLMKLYASQFREKPKKEAMKFIETVNHLRLDRTHFIPNHLELA